jgi:hypothetical protein
LGLDSSGFLSRPMFPAPGETRAVATAAARPTHGAQAAPCRPKLP